MTYWFLSFRMSLASHICDGDLDFFHHHHNHHLLFIVCISDDPGLEIAPFMTCFHFWQSLAWLELRSIVLTSAGTSSLSVCWMPPGNFKMGGLLYSFIIFHPLYVSVQSGSAPSSMLLMFTVLPKFLTGPLVFKWHSEYPSYRSNFSPLQHLLMVRTHSPGIASVYMYHTGPDTSCIHHTLQLLWGVLWGRVCAFGNSSRRCGLLPIWLILLNRWHPVCLRGSRRLVHDRRCRSQQ